MLDSESVFGSAVADMIRLKQINDTRNFQGNSLDAQRKGVDAQRQIANWGRIQTGILTQMSTTLGRMDAEMTAVRKLQTESLAIQKELLQRDNLQAFLEEFIYQAQKLVAECSNDKSDIPASTRYFLLQGLLAYIKKAGVGTPMIRGRENKFAFDSAIEQATSTKQLLAETDEVKKAIAWRNGEQKLLAKAKEAKQIKQGKFALIFLAVVIGIPVLLVAVVAASCLLAAVVGKMSK